MASSQGINKLVVFKKELVAWGTKAVAAGGSYIRRVTATFQLEKDTYTSNEIRPSQQVSDMRHGTRKATGTISGELAGNSYEEFIQAGLRRDFTAGVTTGALTTVAAAVGTFTRSAGSFVSNAFQVGTVISVSGYSTSGNNGLFLITAMSATVLTVSPLAGQTMAIEAAGPSVTILQKGKVTWVPLTSQTDDSFTVEEYYPDSGISRTFLGMQVNSLSFGLQPNGMTTCEIGFLGKDAETPTSSAYFTTPTAVGSEGIYSAPNGFLFINGTSNGVVTGLNLKVDAGITQVPVIGSTSIGAKSRGKVNVTLDGTAIFDSSTILGYFDAETEVSINFVLLSSDKTQAFSFYMPRVKIGSGTVDDGEKNVILSFNGQALEYGGATTGVQATTLLVQDTTI